MRTTLLILSLLSAAPSFALDLGGPVFDADAAARAAAQLLAEQQQQRRTEQQRLEQEQRKAAARSAQPQKSACTPIELTGETRGIDQHYDERTSRIAVRLAVGRWLLMIDTPADGAGGVPSLALGEDCKVTSDRSDCKRVFRAERGSIVPSGKFTTSRGRLTFKLSNVTARYWKTDECVELRGTWDVQANWGK